MHLTEEEMKELNGLAASMGLYDDKNPCKRAVILGKAIKALEQEPCEVSEYDKDHIWYKGRQYISLRRFLEVKAEPYKTLISED